MFLICWSCLNKSFHFNFLSVSFSQQKGVSTFYAKCLGGDTLSISQQNLLSSQFILDQSCFLLSPACDPIPCHVSNHHHLCPCLSFIVSTTSFTQFKPRHNSPHIKVASSSSPACDPIPCQHPPMHPITIFVHIISHLGFRQLHSPQSMPFSCPMHNFVS